MKITNLALLAPLAALLAGCVTSEPSYQTSYSGPKHYSQPHYQGVNKAAPRSSASGNYQVSTRVGGAPSRNPSQPSGFGHSGGGLPPAQAKPSPASISAPAAPVQPSAPVIKKGNPSLPSGYQNKGPAPASTRVLEPSAKNEYNKKSPNGAYISAGGGIG